MQGVQGGDRVIGAGLDVVYVDGGAVEVRQGQPRTRLAFLQGERGEYLFL